ncbi:chaplin family protein [Streptomyces sp. NPDC019396]
MPADVCGTTLGVISLLNQATADSCTN